MTFHVGRLIDHVHLRARDFRETCRFYEAVLPVLGLTIGHSGDDWFQCDEFFVDAAASVEIEPV